MLTCRKLRPDDGFFLRDSTQAPGGRLVIFHLREGFVSGSDFAFSGYSFSAVITN